MLFGDALAEHIKSLKCDPTLKPGTKDYDDRGPRPFTRPGPAWRALIFAGSTRWNASDGLANSPRNTRRRLIITRLLWSNMRSTRLLRRGAPTTILPKLLKSRTHGPRKLTFPRAARSLQSLTTIRMVGVAKPKPLPRT